MIPTLGIALSACPSASFEEHGPRTLVPDGPSERALPRPLLTIEPAATFEDEARRAEVLTLTHDLGTTSVELALVGGEDGGPETERARLVYRIGPRLELPLAIGGRYWFRTSAQRGGDGVLVWVAGAEPTLIAALSIDRGLADDVVPGLTVLAVPVGDPIYSEVRTLPSGCVTTLDHQSLRVRAASASIDIPPGARRRVQHGDRAWDIIALDASRPTPGLAAADAARCPGGAHVSWLALAVDAPVAAPAGAVGSRPSGPERPAP